ncbi:holo-ACP synthase [Komagataeibacter intermedius]|uniref:Holo-[acyl-carrier-protein] synthase n=2 Tax=Komagataeibacter intermedius TaxID=66229 RepID=A0A0N1N6D6_9PROT|nr:holo-ACP synthase [Komagataeibacter intermedius]KPH87598.1 4'-phosphopantetheinyl transferase [Komagataeibacter intermedius AF2]MCF3636316.1 holo-ACP synthase [Komagataeibacter intermedius]GAN85915.1 holo-acyl carrier protein synthase [Komagataeibacter intermedius TF2]GBQ64516.1 holo-ACP synthase [Komagataeibacter intermedius NRIC 0521]
MLIGIGSDLCDARRIETVLARHGARFEERVFTVPERAAAARRHGPARLGTYAKRWAAKEACGKALGTGFSQGVFHRDMGVENLPTGQPVMRLTGGALARLHALVPDGLVARVFLTMTDEHPYAFAQVMIMAEKAGAA